MAAAGSSGKRAGNRGQLDVFFYRSASVAVDRRSLDHAGVEAPQTVGRLRTRTTALLVDDVVTAVIGKSEKRSNLPFRRVAGGLLTITGKSTVGMRAVPEVTDCLLLNDIQQRCIIVCERIVRKVGCRNQTKSSVSLRRIREWVAQERGPQAVTLSTRALTLERYRTPAMTRDGHVILILIPQTGLPDHGADEFAELRQVFNEACHPAASKKMQCGALN